MKLTLNERIELQSFMLRQVKIAMCLKNHNKKQAANEMQIDYKHFCRVSKDETYSISLDIFIAFCDYCGLDLVASIKKANALF